MTDFVSNESSGHPLPLLAADILSPTVLVSLSLLGIVPLALHKLLPISPR